MRQKHNRAVEFLKNFSAVTLLLLSIFGLALVMLKGCAEDVEHQKAMAVKHQLQFGSGSRLEMDAILENLKTHLKGDEILYYWYYELAFWTGCRPSELIALKESDFDFFSGMFKVNKSRVRGVEKNVTKTHTAREVCLNARSKKAAQELIKYKKDRNIQSKYLMLCPETGEPFFNEKPPRNRLVAALKACGIRHRPAYNARHTYATMMLMDGLNPVFVSNQMGHSLQMMMKRYVKWMHGDKNKIEMGKLKTD